MKEITCESEGCDQIAELLDPFDNKLCSVCVGDAVGHGEYMYEECESLS